MGAVGLNFGSPTSGAGFDVSSTVARIVGNLQNVETPWKNQLTQLQSQDKAISSLGTLFSNLSNDLSALTDFQGILAQKTGSSSDINVLKLTAADSTAFSGTHTVVVANLALTGSGYLSVVPSASTPLTGSITLQMGTSGTPKTITLNSTNNTLAGLASAINSSGVGIYASVLTDPSGSRLSLISGTSGANGNFSVTADSITPALSYAASTGDTSSGTLNGIANSATDTFSGSITVKLGSGTAQTIVIGAAPSDPADNTVYTGSGANTLADIQSALAGLGVTATVVSYPDHSSSLSLSSGSAGALIITSNIFDTNAPLAYKPVVTGIDAKLTVDGMDLTSSSNTVANLIPGVTFQLLAPTADNEQVQVVIGNDNTGIESTVAQMVSDYNAAISAINVQEGNDSSNNPEPLFGSPTLSLLQQQLLGSLTTQNPNGYLDVVKNASDMLSGSISIQVGSGTAQNISLPGSGGTLSDLASAINSAGIGVSANIVSDSSGSRLVLVSGTEGSLGRLTVTSSISDSSTGSALGYNANSSDISSLTSLGISVNNDGSLSLNANSLDTLLNSDFNGVVGFFQDANSWGMTVTHILNNAGTGTSTGLLTLAQNSNSTVEANLNASIAKQESLISVQQVSLTAELNVANQILQSLPSQLNSVEMIYSAITGYNSNKG